jgi:hypothetical protein
MYDIVCNDINKKMADYAFVLLSILVSLVFIATVIINSIAGIQTPAQTAGKCHIITHKMSTLHFWVNNI